MQYLLHLLLSAISQKYWNELISILKIKLNVYKSKIRRMIVEPCDDNQLNRKLKSPFVFSSKFLVTMHFFENALLVTDIKCFVDKFEILMTDLGGVNTEKFMFTITSQTSNQGLR